MPCPLRVDEDRIEKRVGQEALSRAIAEIKVTDGACA